jgi:hypothetical protein
MYANMRIFAVLINKNKAIYETFIVRTKAERFGLQISSQGRQSRYLEL